MPAMLGCSTVCPNCKHQFTCLTPVPPTCCTTGRTVQFLSGGGVVMSPPPCPSPSVPVTFVLPPFTTTQPSHLLQESTKSEKELEHLSNIVKTLRLSGWYYEGLTYEKSDELLKNTKVGTFLVRNSSDPRCLFSLGVQTECGPKSVRLFYINGYFRLDALQHLQDSMPLFPGVLELIEYYVKEKKKNEQALIDQQSKCWLNMYFERPLRKEGKPPTLKHLARLAINQQLGDTSVKNILRLELPPSLSAFLVEYPYSL